MTEADAMKPPLGLLVKLGSIVVHADEMTEPGAHHFDTATVRSLMTDPDVRAWVKAMGVYLPRKRSA